MQDSRSCGLMLFDSRLVLIGDGVTGQSARWQGEGELDGDSAPVDPVRRTATALLFGGSRHAPGAAYTLASRFSWVRRLAVARWVLGARLDRDEQELDSKDRETLELLEREWRWVARSSA